MATNLDTVYAHALCLSIHGFSQTRAEAEALAEVLEPMQTRADHWEYGYVIEIKPGELSDETYQGSYGQRNYVIYNHNSHHVFRRPDWLRMGNPATARPSKQ